MSGSTHQSINESCTYRMSSNPAHPNYVVIDSPPSNQTIVMDSGHVYSDLPYQASQTQQFCQASQSSSLPTSRAFLPSDTDYFNNNDGYTGGNTQSNCVHCRYSQTSGQTPPTATHSNAGMTTDATSRQCVIIIVKADINLERLLSIIRLCERE